MKAALWGGIALIAATAVVVLIWRDGHPSGEMPARATTGESLDPSETSSIAALEEPPRGPVARAPVVIAEAPSASGSSGADGPVTLHQRRVRVVDVRDRSPVPGAIVAWRPATLDERALGPDARALAVDDPQEFLLRYGEHIVTDAEGEGEFGYRAGRLFLEGWTDELYGRSHFTLGGLSSAPGEEQLGVSPLVLELEPDDLVEIHTIRADGAPVPGVRIEFEPQTPPRPGLVMATGLGHTNDNGVFTWRHMQEALRADGNPPKTAILATFLGARFGRTELQLDDLPREPVVLVAPDHGHLAIRVLGHDGEPVEPERLIVRVGEQVRSVTREDYRVDEHGVFTLTPVALGHEVEVTARLPLTSVEAVAEGPAFPGERVPITLSPEAGAPEVRARVVDAATGAPLEGLLRVTLIDGSGARQAAHRIPVLGGELSVLVPGELVGEEVELELGDGIYEPEQVPRQAQAATPRILRPGPNDYGELVLAPLPRAIAVQTVLADGEPVPVEAQLYLPPAEEGGRAELLIGGLVHQPAEGITAIYSADPAPRYQVSVRRPWFLLDDEGRAQYERVDLPSSPQVHRLAVTNGGSLSVDFVVDEDTPWEGLLYALDGERHGAPFLQPMRLHDERNPRATVEGLISDLYTLSVSCFGSTEPLLTIPDLRVTVGPCDDERLRGVDLRGLVRSVTLRTVDAAGLPIAGNPTAMVIVVPKRREFSLRGRDVDDADGTVQLEIVRPVDVLATSWRHMTVQSHSVDADRTITLPDRPVLRFVAPALREVDLGDATVRLTLTPDRDFHNAKVLWVPRGRGSVGGSSFAEAVGADAQELELSARSASGELPFRWPDRYRIEAKLVRGSAEHALALNPSALDVRAEDDGREVELELDPAVLSESLEAVSDR